MAFVEQNTGWLERIVANIIGCLTAWQFSYFLSGSSGRMAGFEEGLRN
jgi:hypothetical protein